MMNWIDEKLRKADCKTMDKIREDVIKEESNRSAGGKRIGAGRPKKEENITFSVRGHESVKEATRQFAKTESEKLTKNTEG